MNQGAPYISPGARTSAPAPSGGQGSLAPARKIGPLGWAVARVFPNVSLAVPLPHKTLLGPLLARLWRGGAGK